MKKAALITGIVFAASSMAALADSVTFNFGGSGSSTGLDLTSGTTTVNVKAYSTANTDGSGAFALANIKKWGSGGWGIETSSEPTSSPNHATDNAGKDEFFVLDFGAGANMDLINLGIGWAQERGCVKRTSVKKDGKWVGVNSEVQCADSDSTKGHHSTYIDYQADIDVWIGNTFDISNPFAALTKIHFEDMPAYSSALETGTLTGRYMLIGAESPVEDGDFDRLDYFKLKSVTVEQRDPPSEVPEPSALLLTGLGLISLARARKR